MDKTIEAIHEYFKKKIDELKESTHIVNGKKYTYKSIKKIDEILEMNSDICRIIEETK